MSDSGFSHISAPARPASQNGNGRGPQLVQIIKLPEALANTAKALRLEGEITQKNKDGTVRIHTEKGDIDVKVKGQNTTRKGQRLEIEIPAGRPAKQATIRQATIKQTSNRQISTPSPQQSSTPTVETPRAHVPENTGRPHTTNTTPRLRPSLPQQPLPPSLQENTAQVAKTPAQTQAQARPLMIDSTIRLIGIPPAQAQSIATATTQTLETLTGTLQRLEATATLIAQNATDKISDILTKPQATSLHSKPITQPQPIANKGFFQALTSPQIQNSIALIPPTTSSNNAIQITGLPPLTNTQSIPASMTSPAVSTSPQTASIAPAPIAFNLENPAILTSSCLGKVDVQVRKITPPNIILSAQTTSIKSTPISTPAATQFTPQITSANNAVTLTAQVTGFTSGNLPLVTMKWPGSILPQSFTLQFNSNNLQLGTQLQIIPKGLTAALPTITSASGVQTTNPLLQGFQWPAIDALYNGLSQISAQSANTLTRALPNAGSPAQIAPAAMMFIAAIRSGDFSSWLGDKNIDLLQRIGGESILSRLTQGSGGTMPAPTAESSPSGEWRAIPLPMFWEGEIHRITLYTRQEDQNEKQDNKGNDQTRFIFDLSLSRIGDVQLDGLLQDKRLDLIIRTQNAFSPPMQQTMRYAYSTALNSTDLNGDLSFQGSTQNWVHVLQKDKSLGVEV